MQERPERTMPCNVGRPACYKGDARLGADCVACVCLVKSSAGFSESIKVRGFGEVVLVAADAFSTHLIWLVEDEVRVCCGDVESDEDEDEEGGRA